MDIDGTSTEPSSEMPMEGRVIDVDLFAEKVASTIQQKLRLPANEPDSTMPSEIMVDGCSTQAESVPRFDIKLGICVYKEGAAAYEYVYMKSELAAQDDWQGLFDEIRSRAFAQYRRHIPPEYIKYTCTDAAGDVISIASGVDLKTASLYASTNPMTILALHECSCVFYKVNGTTCHNAINIMCCSECDKRFGRTELRFSLVLSKIESIGNMKTTNMSELYMCHYCIAKNDTRKSPEKLL
ncbi:hypothetical protein MPSEU_000555100 [Mayamaea pseudoterrestris]|nr:hypothetical protein MPSEU_000555100 [Mayamaea pseudoterrestris]